jgi:hypothetical protein
LDMNSAVYVSDGISRGRFFFGVDLNRAERIEIMRHLHAISIRNPQQEN